MANSGLSIKNLTFSFNKRAFTFFNNLSLTFSAKSMHFVKGRNGVGKSTLFRLLRAKVGVSEVIKGTVCLNDVCYDLPEMQKEGCYINEIKMVQQKFDQMLADQLTFTENLKLANLPHLPTLSPIPMHEKIPDLISRFNISMETPVFRLSGGQRQILAILMSLQKPTKVLLLDEPTAALDDKNTSMVMQFLGELIESTGLTIIVICHDKEVIEKYAGQGRFEISVDDETLSREIVFKKA